MTDKPSTIRLSPELRAAIDDVRHASVSRQAWVEHALEAALSEAKGAPKSTQAGPAPVPSGVPLPGDGVRPAAPPPALPPPPFVAEEDRCNPCKRHGPPRSGRPCSSCGHSTTSATPR